MGAMACTAAALPARAVVRRRIGPIAASPRGRQEEHAVDTGYLFLAIVFSAAGMAYFMYGKKQSALVPLLCGVALMAYPYFVSSTLWLVVIGACLSAIPYFVRI